MNILTHDTAIIVVNKIRVVEMDRDKLLIEVFFDADHSCEIPARDAEDFNRIQAGLIQMLKEGRA